MMQLNNLKSKPHHIVILREDNELDALAVTKILGYFNDVLVLNNIKNLKPIMLDKTPKVIFFSNQHLETSFQQYYALIENIKEGDLCDHKFVIFCNKKDEEVAFAAYNTEIVDEYLVSRPLYEITRPILLTKQLLRELGVHYASNGRVEYKLTNLELRSELTRLIENTLERKKVFRQDFEKSIVKLDSAISAAQDKFSNNQKADLDLNEVKTLLGQIRSNEIRPELLELQNKALSLLNKFVKSTSNIVSKMEPTTDNTTDNSAATSQNKVNANRSSIETQNANASSTEVKNSNTVPKTTIHSNNLGTDIDYEKRLNEVQARSKIRVLLVEDDEISLNLSAKLFKNKRFEFDYAVSGREALNKLNNKKYDIVFMDINLPDSDGLSLLSQLSNNESINVSTPIVVLTGNHSKLSVKRAGQVGAKTYLIKPLRQASLLQALEKCNLV